MNNLLPTAKRLITIGLFLAAMNGQSQQTKVRIDSIMQVQAKAWNQGDLRAFMQYYWRSDSLCFIGGQGPKYGWDTTLKRYQTVYSDREKMGKLKFTNLTIDPLSEERILVMGQWQLERKDGPLGGFYTLIWRKIQGQWLIIYDHSSSVKME